MNRFLIIAATVAVLVIASTSSPACIETPAQWSGHIYEISLLNALRKSIVNYDRNAKQLKITDYKGVTLRTTLFRYDTGIKYVSCNGQCTKSTITDDMPTFGVPNGAKCDPNGVKYLGGEANGTGILVHEFYGFNTTQGDYYLTYTPIGDGTQCVPLFFTFMSRSLKLQEFINIDTKLPPNPFIMPPGC